MPQHVLSRQLHASAPAAGRRKRREVPLQSVFDRPPVSLETDFAVEEEEAHDVTSAGHLWLRQQRRMLYYMRLIELEVPQLVRE